MNIVAKFFEREMKRQEKQARRQQSQIPNFMGMGNAKLVVKRANQEKPEKAR